MKHRVTASLTALLAGILALLLTNGCAWSVGSPSKADRVEQQHPIQTPTTGQQLIDLKQALDQGAMTQAEYDAAKAKLLQQ
ncbi:MAG: SHOCT domain-containing protein [Verrucomicrobiae bacterium]|nr:SHOCT domain-containing protein [Verrucomicrobiae bacterium]MCP5524495.1 SHOCT domain-containing protein [Verrucomicrobiales bacterium]